MNDIEQKALALIAPGAGCEVNFENISILARAFTSAIEQHEAFRQEVSDAVELSIDRSGHDGLRAGHINEYLGRFIIPAPKPDPLVDVMKDLSWDEETAAEDWATDLRSALEARGLEIREKGQ